MHVVTIPCLSDNYAYLLVGDRGRDVAVVDPAESEPVANELSRLGRPLTQIWLTHHHWDHVGGVEALCDAHPGVEVLGSAHDLEQGRIPRQTRGLREGDRLIFDDREVAVIAIPGHTLGAVAFLVDGMLFSGDTLFAGGCGRVFEGTMSMMKDSLAKLRELPDETRVYCGHEYTLRNLEFAQSIEADNPAIAAALARTTKARQSGKATVPTTMAVERETNPFLRFDVATVARGRESVATFEALRKAKDRF